MDKKVSKTVKNLFSGNKDGSTTGVPTSRGTRITPNSSPGTLSTVHAATQYQDVILDTLEATLDLFNVSSDWFTPLKSAVGGVCECIRVYKKTSENQEKITKLTLDIADIIKSIEEQYKKGASSDMERHFESLTRKLNEITLKAREKQEHNLAQQFVQANRDSQDIDDFFEKVKMAYADCKVMF
ncbi:hypothetical protein VKT23_007621 [Stygiomarasmius scandens]|uniref:Uncharacterized protein n=1 Tax=Marasmiellus scandens TaxID=2682957 RepID=A0ABR1JNL9_9AGAR